MPRAEAQQSVHDIAYLTIGQSKLSWQLPGDYQIAGITVHNPSGHWLRIPQDNSYVPPYTMGWAHSFAPTQSRIDILFANGPAGQISTVEGDNPTAQIYDKPVAESAGVASSGGSAFIEDFTRVQRVELQQAIPTGLGFNSVILPAITGKRYRLLTLSFDYSYDQGAIGNRASPVTGNMVSGGSAFLNFGCTPDKVTDRIWPDGLDLPVGGNVDLTLVALWAVEEIVFLLTYQLI